MSRDDDGTGGTHSDPTVGGRPMQKRQSTTHHAPRKKLLNKLHALITSPKRAYGHAERDGFSGLMGRSRRESMQEQEHSRESYVQKLGSDAGLSSPASAASAAQSQASPSSSVPPATSTPGSTSPTNGALWLSPEPRPRPTSSSNASPLSYDSASSSQPPVLFRSDTEKPPSTALKAAKAQGDPQRQQQSTLSPVEIIPPVLLRPHLKMRIVTWNMHDSLPTGDLTELLGSPSASCSAMPTEQDRPKPLDPEHVIQPLSSGLDAHSPYHIVVVGGQEVPVGYGGWSGPNWTEIIQRWLAGKVPQSSREEDLNSVAGSRSSLPPPSPNTAYRQYLEHQDTDQTVSTIPVDNSNHASPDPRAETPNDDRQLETLTCAAMNSRTISSESTEDQTLEGASSSMDRTDSASTATTQLSRITDQSPHVGPALASDPPSSAGSSSTTTAGTTPGIAQHAAEAALSNDEEAESPYVLVTKERLMGIYCSMWVHRSCAHLIQGSSTGTVTAGLLAGKLGNKGAACISLMIAETRFLFVCAHLAAHSQKAAIRQQNVKKIKDELIIDTFRHKKAGIRKEPKLKRGFSISRPQRDYDQTDSERAARDYTERLQAEWRERREAAPDKDITDDFDYTFWFGDLNFRLDISRLHADFLIKEKKYDTALTFDQLVPIMKEPTGCFRGFEEAVITFPPSYKYDVLKLKRSKTVQRSAPGGTGLSHSEKRAVKHLSAPASSSAAGSRTNLLATPLDEEDEEDRRSLNDRATLSSRASISSAFSGFDAPHDGPEDADPETLANTNHNNRISGGLFGTSIPSTPVADKVFDKAKGFFNIMRTRSTSNVGEHNVASAEESSAGRSQRLFIKTSGLSNHDTLDTGLLSPPSTAFERAEYRQTYEKAHNVPRPSSPGGEYFRTTQSGPVSETTADSTGRRQSLEVPGSRPIMDQPMRSSTPVAMAPAVYNNSRPRLRSTRSSNTVLSLSSLGGGRSLASNKEPHTYDAEADEAVFDTSTKKRVQSWTDRILYKSTIPVVTDIDTAPEHGAVLHSIGDTLLNSLRGIKRTFREPRLEQTGDLQDTTSAPPQSGLTRVVSTPRVSFQKTSPRIDSATDTIYNFENSSKTSMSHSHQRVEGRLAKLFQRHSGPNANTTTAGGRENGQITAKESLTSQQSSLLGNMRGTSPKKLSRSFSTQSRTRRSHAMRKGSDEVLPATAKLHDSTIVESTQPAGRRVKPSRSYTSPSLARVSSRTSGDSTLATFTRRESTTPKTSDSLGTVPHNEPFNVLHGQSLHSGASLLSRNLAPVSEGMARVGSEPVYKSEKTEWTVDQSSVKSRRKGELLSQAQFEKGTTGTAHDGKEARDTVVQPMPSPPAVKTGIDLSQSKTTPLPGSHIEHSSGLRQWLNHRLPQIFSFHASDHGSPASFGQNTETSLEPPNIVEPPKPQPDILGPRRGQVQCISYDSVADLRRMDAYSDHRPVIAVFAVGL